MIHVYVGTYTQTVHFSSGKVVDGKGKGIYHLVFDPEEGKLEMRSVEPGVANPSYVAFSPDKRFLYAASETKECRGGHFGGEIGAYRILDNGDLKFMNSQVSDGWDSCHVAVNEAGTFAVISNYGSCTAAVFPILEDGFLAEHCQFIEHRGSGVHPKRQKKAFPHSTIFSPDGQFAYILDLGMDQLVAYRISPDGGPLVRDETASFALKPGSGPRHAEWHPNQKYLYVVDELSCAVTCLEHNPGSGCFREVQTITTLLDGRTGDFTSADIHMTPDGRFVYASTRGSNTLACYRIDQATGRMTAVQSVSSGGEVPRGFAIDPSGRRLLAANQNTHNIVVFSIDQETGMLERLQEIRLPNPVCIKMAALKS